MRRRRFARDPRRRSRPTNAMLNRPLRIGPAGALKSVVGNVLMRTSIPTAASSRWTIAATLALAPLCNTKSTRKRLAVFRTHAAFEVPSSRVQVCVRRRFVVNDRRETRDRATRRPSVKRLQPAGTSRGTAVRSAQRRDAWDMARRTLKSPVRCGGVLQLEHIDAVDRSRRGPDSRK